MQPDAFARPHLVHANAETARLVGLDSRAQALIDSHEPVYPEQVETGAILVRLARRPIRCGSFEYFHYRGD